MNDNLNTVVLNTLIKARNAIKMTEYDRALSQQSKEAIKQINATIALIEAITKEDTNVH